MLACSLCRAVPHRAVPQVQQRHQRLIHALHHTVSGVAQRMLGVLLRRLWGAVLSHYHAQQAAHDLQILLLGPATDAATPLHLQQQHKEHALGATWPGHGPPSHCGPGGGGKGGASAAAQQWWGGQGPGADGPVGPWPCTNAECESEREEMRQQVRAWFFAEMVQLTERSVRPAGEWAGEGADCGAQEQPL